MKQILQTLLLSFLFSSSFSQTIIPGFYHDNFDTVNVWTDTIYNASGSSWELGTPNYGVTNSTHSGINSWDIALDSAYKPNTIAVLTSPYFDFTNCISAHLSFWFNLNTQNDSDGFRVDFSDDGGMSWDVLGNINDFNGTNWYNTACVGNTAKPGWTGNSGGWVKSSYRLDALNGNPIPVLFRFVFTSDNSIESDGLSIDDVAIEYDPVNIYWTDDSIGNNCQVPQTVKLQCYGIVNTGLFNDTVSMHILFGDGTDTVFQQVAYPGFYSTVYHDYNMTGNFTVAFIATNSLGHFDTLTSPSQIELSNNCGNVSGIVYADYNNNCIYDPGELLMANRNIFISDVSNSFSQYAFTDTSGFYSFNVLQSHIYDVRFLSPSHLGAVCPGITDSGISSFPSVNNNFGIDCAPGFELGCYLSGVIYRPGMTKHFAVIVNNSICQTIGGSVKLLLDSNLTFLNSNPPPSQISGDTLIWNFNPLSYNERFLSYINVLTDTQAVLGSYLHSKCFVEPVIGDVDTSNNIFISSDWVNNSYDPNIKTVNPVGNISTNQTLTYTINFQNTGNDVAYNVFILDTLDAGLDASTLNPVASSHSMQTEILNGNVLHFMFNNIQLPDSGSNEPASHGFVAYTVKPKSTLTPGTQIKNTSYIYFDFNSPVITNTTTNTISLIASNNDIIKTENSLKVYPNPANNNIQFKLEDAHQKISSIKIINALGQIKFSENESPGFLNIDLNKWNQGIYFYRIISDNQEYFSGIFEINK